MAKGDRWSDNRDVKVREMRNAETVLGVNRRPLESRLRSKDSRPVRRGAVGKGLREMYLAGRLPYLTSSSEGRGWRQRHLLTRPPEPFPSERDYFIACP